MVVELVLGGTARDLIRELPIDSKTNGVMFDPGDGQGPRQYSGINFIITVLTVHFAHLDEEESARQLMELWQFRRRPGETMDAYLARFSILHHRSTTINGIALSLGQQCFTLMHGMGMSNRDMWDCLRTLNGRMPQDQAELQRILTQLRRYGHIVEQQGHHHHHQPRHFSTTTGSSDNDGHIMALPVDMFNGLPGHLSSPLIGGGGGSAPCGHRSADGKARFTGKLFDG